MYSWTVNSDGHSAVLATASYEEGPSPSAAKLGEEYRPEKESSFGILRAKWWANFNDCGTSFAQVPRRES